MSEIGEEILKGLEEAVAYERGELTEADGVKVYHYPAPPKSADVKAVRKKLGLTQQEFTRFGFTKRAIQNWERGVRRPEGPARTLLAIINKHPEIVLQTLKEVNEGP